MKGAMDSILNNSMEAGPALKKDDDIRDRPSSSFINRIIILCSMVIVGVLVYFSVFNTLFPHGTVPMPAWNTTTASIPLNRGSSNQFSGQIGLYDRLKSIGLQPKHALSIGPGGSDWGDLLQSVYGSIPIHLMNYGDGPHPRSRYISVNTDINRMKPLPRTIRQWQPIYKPGEAVVSYTIDNLVSSIPAPNIVRFSIGDNAIGLLEGAENVLKHIEALVLDFNMLDGYINNHPKPLAVLSYLNKLDFQLLDIAEYLKFFRDSYVPSLNPVTVVLVHKNSALSKAQHAAAELPV